MDTIIRIRSKKDGFRRCGMAHSKEWQEHPKDAFTPEQLAALKADPMLQVEVADLFAEADAKTGNARKHVQDAAAKRIEELEARIKERNETLSSLGKKNSDLVVECDEKSGRIAELTRDLDVAAKENADQAKRIEELEKALADAEAKDGKSKPKGKAK